MNTRGPLDDIIDALASMDAGRIVSAAITVESMQGWSEEELRPQSDALRRATDLARGSSELWMAVCEHAALVSAGYSALGVPAEPDANQTGALCG